MTIEDAMKSAKQRGMIPFFTVIPVSPQMMRDHPDADKIVGQAAFDEFANQVRKWKEENSEWLSTDY